MIMVELEKIVMLYLIEWNKIEMRMKKNDHFIIMFNTIKNGMYIPSHFYVWYNKIV